MLSFLRAIRDRLFGRLIAGYKLVGRDIFNNEYYESTNVNSRSRRIVVPPKKGGHRNPQTYNSSLIPPEWHAWLWHQRIEAPSENNAK